MGQTRQALTATRVVAVGDAIIAPGVTRRLIAQFADQPHPRRGPKELTGITGREREVLRLVGLVSRTPEGQGSTGRCA